MLIRILTKIGILENLDFLFEKISDHYGIFATYKIRVLFETKRDFFQEAGNLKANPYVRRFNSPELFNKIQTTKIAQEKIGLVLQGPIFKKNDFTLNTASYYLQNFEQIFLVISTWESEDISIFDGLQAEFTKRLKIIQNEEPEYSGIFNLNRQIISSAAGIKSLKESGIEISVKSRTDQRITNPLAFENLFTLYDIFNGQNEDGKKKIIVSSFNTFKFRLYGLSDMFQFGRTDDLMKFWSCPIDLRTVEEINRIKSYNLIQESSKRHPEVYLVSEYLKSNKEETFFELNASRKLVREYFAIIDDSYLGTIWPKYTYFENRWENNSYPDQFNEMKMLDFISPEHESNFLDIENSFIRKDWNLN